MAEASVANGPADVAGVQVVGDVCREAVDDGVIEAPRRAAAAAPAPASSALQHSDVLSISAAAVAGAASEAAAADASHSDTGASVAAEAPVLPAADVSAAAAVPGAGAASSASVPSAARSWSSLVSSISGLGGAHRGPDIAQEAVPLSREARPLPKHDPFLLSEVGWPLSGGASASNAGRRERSPYRVRYCTPHARVLGQLTLGAGHLRFVPDPTSGHVREFGTEVYGATVKMRDILECGAVVLPLEDSDNLARALFFLQLHLRTWDGRHVQEEVASGQAEKQEEHRRVVFRMRSREELMEAVQSILAAVQASKGLPQLASGDQPLADDVVTKVPFPSLDCVAELEAAQKQHRLMSAKGGNRYRIFHAGDAEALTPPTHRRPYPGQRLAATVSEAAATAADDASRAAASTTANLWKSWSNVLGTSGGAAAAAAAPLLLPLAAPAAGVALLYRSAGRAHAERRTASPQVGDTSTTAGGGARCVPPLVKLRPAVRPDGTPLKRTLLTMPFAEHIAEYLPISVRLPGSVEWVLKYSPKADGVSLSTLYRNLAESDKSVVIVEDTEGYVFGGFATAAWEPKHKFFGSGEAFVFTFGKVAGADAEGAEGTDGAGLKLSVFPWTSTNSFMMYGDFAQIAMGGGDGRHALAIRSDLLRGLSSPTATFGNTMLASAAEFVVRDIEIWALKAPGDE